jgi:hypothetical protein
MILIDLAELASAPDGGAGIRLTVDEARDILAATGEAEERAAALRRENHRLRAENARLSRLLRTEPVPATAYLERRRPAAAAA